MAWRQVELFCDLGLPQFLEATVDIASTALSDSSIVLGYGVVFWSDVIAHRLDCIMLPLICDGFSPENQLDTCLERPIFRKDRQQCS